MVTGNVDGNAARMRKDEDWRGARSDGLQKAEAILPANDLKQAVRPARPVWQVVRQPKLPKEIRLEGAKDTIRTSLPSAVQQGSGDQHQGCAMIVRGLSAGV